MPDPELLPPPPPKNRQPESAEGGLLPPPPKKKENVGSKGGATHLEDGLSNTQTDEFNSFGKSLGKTGFDNVLNVEGAAPLPQRQQGFKDLSVKDFTSRKKEAGLLPNISDYAVKDNTINVQPDITGNHIDYVQHNEERKQKHEALVEDAIKNTAEKYLKNQGVIVTDEDKKGIPERLFVQGKPFGDKEVVSKNSTLYNQTVQKYREAYQKGDATFAIDKDGTVGLNRTIGPIEGLSKGWNNATKEADFNHDFVHNMNDEERVAALEQRAEQNTHPEYLGERGNTAGSVAQWGAEQAPFLAKAGTGYLLGATVAAAAPATGGLSLAGAPLAMSFLATANDMANGGAANEIQRRYAILRHDHPEADPVDLMHEAYKGGLVGGVAGIATNALLMGEGGEAATNVLKQSVSNEGKSVIKNTLKNIYKSSVHMGNVGAAIEGSKQAIGAMEGVHTIPSDVAKDMANSWSENAKTGALLTGVMSAGAGLPKVLVSAFKYALKDTPKDVIKATLKFNEDNGIIPKGVTDNVIADLQAYDNALAQVPKGLSPEAQASMAGLIEKQTKLQEELKGKHKVANADLEIKIKAIDEQIAKINETGKPFSAEIDEMSGDKYTQRTPEEKNGIVVTPPQSFPEPVTIGEKNESAATESPTPETSILDKAKELVNSGVVKGYTADILKESANNNPEEFKQHLKDISEQAQDPQSEPATVKTYGQELVDLANELNPPKDETTAENKVPVGETKESPSKEVVDNNERQAGEDGGQEPPKVEGGAAVMGSEEGGITHAANDERRNEVGLGEYEKEQQSFEQWSKEADEKLAKGYDMEKLLKKMENKEATTPVENAIRKKYIASLDKQLSENPTPELLAAKTRYTRIQDLSNSEAGRQLVSLKGMEGAEDNLSNFLLNEANAAQVETLPKEVISDLKKKYEADNEVVQKLNDRIAQLEEAAANKKIAEEVVKSKRASQGKAKKTAEDFTKERQDIKQSIKDKLKKARGETSAIVIPYAKELIAISPDVLKLVKSYIDEGVTNLAEIVKRSHSELKDDLPDITERDIRDIIKGEYTEKKQTKNQIAAQMRDLKSQQALLDKLESMRNGEPSKDPIKRQKRSDEIEKILEEIKKFTDKQKDDAAEIVKQEKEIENKKKAAAKEEERLTKEFEAETNKAKKAALEAKVKEAKRISSELDKKTPEESKLQSYKTGLKNKIEKLKKDLDTGDYLKEPEPKKPIKLDTEAEKLLDEHIRFVKETALRRAKAEFANRSKGERIYDGAMQILGIKRIVQTAIDLSIPFRQGVTIAFNPRRWATFGKSFQAMLQSVFNAKKFDRIMYGIHKSADYQNMLKDNVTFNEMDAVDSNSKNEDFQKSFVYKVPLVREPLLASNRAADGFLNVARYDMYMNGKSMLEKQGITRENSPEHYKALGKWVMNSTGRGNMLKFIEDSHSGRMVASNTFFGARLMASRFNLLNPLYYAKMPKEVRVAAMKDMATYVGMITATLLAAKAAGATVSTDVDNADFMKIKVGNTKYDITGGMVQYLRTYMRLNKMVSNRLFEPNMSKADKDKYAAFALKSGFDFFQYKLAPNTSYVLSSARGKDAVGKEFNPYDALKIYPMYVDDMIDGYKQSGLTSLVTIGLPSLLGVGVQTYADKPKIFGSNELDASVMKSFKSKGIEIPESGSVKQYKLKVDEKHPNIAKEGDKPYGVMSDAEFAEFNKDRKDDIADALKKALEKPYFVDGKEYTGKDLPKQYNYLIKAFIEKKISHANKVAKREILEEQ